MNYADLPVRYRSLGNSPDEIQILAKPDSPLPIEYENKYVVLLNDHVRFPGGGEGQYLRLFSRSGLEGKSGAVALTRKDGNYILLNVYRHPIRSWETECPRGFGEKDETPEQSMRREIKEELGVDVIESISLGELCPDSGMQASHVKMFLADLVTFPKQKSEEGAAAEGIAGYKLFRREELIDAIARGDIHDSFTLSAVSVAWARGLL
jgi:ADP-ribose pyrophosphatase